jgi:hypothetical protein
MCNSILCYVTLISGQGELVHTLVLTIIMQKLKIFYLKNFGLKFGFKSINLV